MVKCMSWFSLHSAMGGPAAPDSSWKGSLNVSYNIGPGFTGNSSTRSVLTLTCLYNIGLKKIPVRKTETIHLEILWRYLLPSVKVIFGDIYKNLKMN